MGRSSSEFVLVILGVGDRYNMDEDGFYVVFLFGR